MVTITITKDSRTNNKTGHEGAWLNPSIQYHHFLKGTTYE
jgi:hypothetical protein